MQERDISIDIERLRNDMQQDCLGAFLVGGFGAALFDSSDVGRARACKKLGSTT